jgi:hypothetical protein
MVTKVPGSGTGVVAMAMLAEVAPSISVNPSTTWAGAAVSPMSNGPGVYVPARSTTRNSGVSFNMEPPVAAKVPSPGFEMENPPPVETVVSVRVNGPNGVPNATLNGAKSPVPKPEVIVPTALKVVAVLRFSPPR